MLSRRAVVTVLSITILLVAAVQLADPQFEQRQPPEVDFSEPPSEVAADAAAQFEYIDYAYRVEIADNRSGEWRRYISARVSHSDRVYRSMGPAKEEGGQIFATDAVTYVKFGKDGTWRLTPDPDTRYPQGGVIHPFNLNKIRKSSVQKIDEGETTLMLSVDTNPLNAVTKRPGNATIVLDKEEQTIKIAKLTYKGVNGNTRFVRLKFTELQTPMERPAGIHFSIQEVIWDLMRGPLFELFDGE